MFPEHLLQIRENNKTLVFTGKIEIFDTNHHQHDDNTERSAKER